MYAVRPGNGWCKNPLLGQRQQNGLYRAQLDLQPVGVSERPLPPQIISTELMRQCQNNSFMVASV